MCTELGFLKSIFNSFANALVFRFFLQTIIFHELVVIPWISSSDAATTHNKTNVTTYDFTIPTGGSGDVLQYLLLLLFCSFSPAKKSRENSTDIECGV